MYHCKVRQSQTWFSGLPSSLCWAKIKHIPRKICWFQAGVAKLYWQEGFWIWCQYSLYVFPKGPSADFVRIRGLFRTQQAKFRKCGFWVLGGYGDTRTLAITCVGKCQCVCFCSQTSTTDLSLFAWVWKLGKDIYSIYICIIVKYILQLRFHSYNPPF